MVDPTNSPSSEEELSPVPPESGVEESESTEEGEPQLADTADDSEESPTAGEDSPAADLNVEDPQPVPVETGHNWVEETPAGAVIPHSASDSQDELVEAALAQATEAVDDAEPGILHGDDLPPELTALTQLDQGEEPPQEDVQLAAGSELEHQALVDAAETAEDQGEPEPVQQQRKPAVKSPTKSTEKTKKPGSSAEPKSEPTETPETEPVNPHAGDMKWYVLKVSSNQETSVRDSLLWRIKLEGLEEFFGEIIIPTEKVAEKTKTGKKRIVKRKLFPGYMMIHMVLNDETWYLVRDTNGISDFTGAAGKPIPMQPHEVARMLGQPVDAKTGIPTGAAKKDDEVTIDIPYSEGDTVKINDGGFVGWEGVIDKVDPVNGKITVMVKILGQDTSVELEYWQVEGA